MAQIADMEVRIIHLERAAGRRALMEDALARAGVRASGWGAVDGRDPAQAPRLATLPDDGPWGPMDFHAKGCLLSHLDALQAFLDGAASHLMVLEDDVFIAEDLHLWLAGGWWPDDADIVKVERWRDDRLLVLMGRAGQPRHGRALHRLWTRHSGAAGYVVTRDAAQRIVDANRGHLPVDHLLFNPAVSRLSRGLRLYQVSPALVQQGNMPAPAPGAEAAPAPATPARARLSPRQKLTRLRADLWALTRLPGLVLGRLSLMRVGFSDARLAEGRT